MTGSRRERKKRHGEKEIAAQIHASAYESAPASALSVQVGLRLDPAIANRLRASERGLSDEIRERLERTFKYDEVDPVTRELLEGLINIAALLRVDFRAEWHAWPGAYRAFAEAVAQRLSAYAPGPGMLVDPEAAIQEDELETIGRMRERDDRRAHDYQRLKVAQGFHRRHPKKSGSDE